jgi:peptidyl-prolyl cis-trans isomerase D
MMNFFRKHHQLLMILITFLVIIAFVFLYNRTQFSELDRDRIGHFHGRPVSITEAQRETRKFNLALELGLIELAQSLAGMAQNQPQEAFFWNSLIVNYEGDRLDLHPTDDEVASAIRNVAAFHTNGAFDPQKFALFSQESLSPRGMSQTQLEELVRTDLRLKRIKDLLQTGVGVSPEAVRKAYERDRGRMDVGVVRLPLEGFRKEITISEEELRTAYDARKEGLLAPEQRRVKVAQLLLTPDEQKLEPKDRIAALQKYADKVNELTQKMLEPNSDFDKVTSELQVPVKETALFTVSKPDPLLGDAPNAADAAFRLSDTEPNSDAIQTENGYYVLRLVEVVPARPLEFEEARAQLSQTLIDERARETAHLKASELKQKIAADMGTGKTFSDAATAAGQTPETMSLSPAEPPADKPDASIILQTAIGLEPGHIAEPTPTETALLLIALNKREPVDAAQMEQELPTYTASIKRRRREITFQEWLRVRRKESNIL